jgi:uncharacterized membrane protein
MLTLGTRWIPLLLAAHSAHAQSFEILPPLAGDSTSWAYGVSGDGSVPVGRSSSGAVRWVAGLPQLLVAEPSTSTAAYAASMDGSVVVGSRRTAANYPEAFRWTASSGATQLLVSASALDCSSDGSVIVGRHDPSGFGVSPGGFIWNAGTLIVRSGNIEHPVGITRVSANGAHVGGYFSQWSAQATIWNNQGSIEAVLGSGVVSGVPGSLPPATGYDGLTPLLWLNTAYTLPIATGPWTPQACSDDGHVVVGCRSNLPQPGSDATLWNPAAGSRNLKTILLDLGVAAVADWTIHEANDVSIDGRVVIGVASRLGQIRGFRATLPAYCQPNCDSSTETPVLNVADFSCFLTRFAAGDALYANCDQSTRQPILNVADFTCFLQRFAAGCP